APVHASIPGRKRSPAAPRHTIPEWIFPASHTRARETPRSCIRQSVFAASPRAPCPQTALVANSIPLPAPPAARGRDRPPQSPAACAAAAPSLATAHTLLFPETAARSKAGSLHRPTVVHRSADSGNAAIPRCVPPPDHSLSAFLAQIRWARGTGQRTFHRFAATCADRPPPPALPRSNPVPHSTPLSPHGGTRPLRTVRMPVRLPQNC